MGNGKMAEKCFIFSSPLRERGVNATAWQESKTPDKPGFLRISLAETIEQPTLSGQRSLDNSPCDQPLAFS